ncbi:MAG: helix-turn-helix domain-containing protein [Nanoarchaeota archaeon]
MVNISERLHELPDELGIRLEKIAADTGVSHQNLLQIIARDNAYYSTLNKLAKGLDLIPVGFYSDDGLFVQYTIHEHILGFEQYNYFGRVIKDRRVDLGLSVKDTAKKVGVNPLVYYRYENGEQKPPTKTIDSISSQLQLKHGYLIQKTPDMELMKTSDILFHVSLNVQMALEGKGLPESDIKAILGYAAKIIEIR